MKTLKHFEFVVLIPLLIIILTLIVTYTFASVSVYIGLNGWTLILTYFIQLTALLILTVFFLRKSSKEYFKIMVNMKINPINSFLFCFLFSLIIMLSLFLFDYFFSWIIKFSLSDIYGSYLDNLLDSPDVATKNSSSFKILPITLQNIVLNVIGFLMILIISKRLYTKKYNKYHSKNL
jgi:hypothetical protein